MPMLSSLAIFDILGKEAPVLMLVYGFIGAVLIYQFFGPSNLRNIPTEGGSSLPILSYMGVYNLSHNSVKVLQKGYNKNKGKIFKVALPDRWLVAITGTKLVDEIQRMPDDKLSFTEAVADVNSFRYIFGDEINDDPFHVRIVRDKMTHNLVPIFSEVHDEVEAAVRDLIPANEHEWLSIPAITTARTIVARASGRIFVGLPLCRNKSYLDLSTGFTRDVGKSRHTLLFFPRFLRHIAARVLTRAESRIEECRRLIEPTVLERMDLMEKLGDQWNDRPNDVLQWIIEEAKVRNQGPYEVARMILVMNLVSIHTTSNSLTHALFHLAAAPEYIALLRDEIEIVIAGEGWTKAAMGKLRKLDSFLRESQRMNGINTTSITRSVLQPITLSDGTHLPKGTTLATPALATHCDVDNYSDPLVFDPFRYISKDGQDNSAKHQFVTTSADYVAFGHGKHACPGRFFAVSELKAIMAHLLVNYDVKLEQEGVRPPNLYDGVMVHPNPTAKVLFKKRQMV